MAAPRPKSVAIAPGAVLDHRFEIKEFLGAGAFGAVYRAKQLVFGYPLRDVALKLFKADRVSRDNFHDVFSDAITLIGLQEESPSRDVADHLVQVYDIGVLQAPAEQAFISMRYVTGGKTLESAVRRWRHSGMPVELSLQFLRQILVPLAWMHTLENPAVHADLKPENVLLQGSMHLILTDFGLATRLPLGAMGGTVAYQSPELLLGNMAGAGADVYALGLIWYEMLTGRHPFSDVGLEASAAGDETGFARAHLASRKWPMRPARPSDTDDTPRIPPPAEINEQVGEYPQLELMLQRCLAYKQSERYANAALLLRDLDAFLENKPLGPSWQPPPPADPAPVALPQRTPEMTAREVGLLLGAGRRDEALALAEELVRRQPQFLAGILALARVLATIGQTDRARELCRGAQQLNHEDPEVFATMAEVYQAAAKPAMAASCREQERRLRQQKTQRKTPRGAP